MDLAKGKSDIRTNIYMAFGLGSLTIFSGFPTLIFQLSVQIPEYLKVLPEERWPSISHFALFLYQLLIVNFWVVPSIVLLILIFIVITMSKPSLSFRRTLDVMPPWSVQRSVQASSFMVGLGTLLNQRIAFPLAIEKIETIAPLYMRLHLEKMQGYLNENLELEDVIDSSFLPKKRMDYIRDFVGQNSFSNVLLKQGNEEIKELPNRIKVMMMTFVTVLIISVFSLTIYVGISGQQVGIAAKEYQEEIIRH